MLVFLNSQLKESNEDYYTIAHSDTRRVRVASVHVNFASFYILRLFGASVNVSRIRSPPRILQSRDSKLRSCKATTR